MGSATFETLVFVSRTTSDRDAFEMARDRAAYECGHGGYSGTIAEKSDAVTVHRAKCEANARRMAEALLGLGHLPVYRDEMTRLFEDKGNPAGAIRFPVDKTNDGILFFGYART